MTPESVAIWHKDDETGEVVDDGHYTNWHEDD